MICSTLLLCAASVTWAASVPGPDDAVALLQRPYVHTHEQEVRDVRWTLPDGVQTVGYTFEGYKVGDFVEGRAKNGSWVPCIVTQPATDGFYNVHVASSFPGYDLPSVPSSLLRRPLTDGLQDFYVDNSVLQHPGPGLKFRHSKDLHDKSDQFAPWGSLVVALDNGDGWVKAGSGYLPYMIHGSQVLRPRVRAEPSIMPLMRRFVGNLQANVSASLPFAAPKKEPPVFAVGEKGSFRTKGGEWYPMQIRGPGSAPGTYNIVMEPTDHSYFPKDDIPVGRLRKSNRTHDLQEGEAPLCKRGGCVTVRVKSPKGQEFQVQVAKIGKLDMMMRVACNRLKMPWDECKKRVGFRSRGLSMDSSMQVSESGLENQTLVEMWLRGRDR
mmetsp:Transcript_33515/g.77911  ORF Transcript_33515/g.77911 Transcript_33515/m.77911 type:complete len:382 (-) Transcript_33515:87-1232(-)